MPELPEVETIVNDLNQKILGQKIKDIWCDWKKMIVRPSSFEQFRKELIRRRFKKVWRRGKNIIFDLSGGKNLLIHLRMTGHIIVQSSKLVPSEAEGFKVQSYEDDYKYIHLTFKLSGEMEMGLSDLRKFAKVMVVDSKDLESLEVIKKLGPEPLERDFTLRKFKERVEKKKGKIKQVLMDQKVIAGIGNIYSDEILWEAEIHPFFPAEKLSNDQKKALYQAIKKILRKAIQYRGNSIADYRDTAGKKGRYQEIQKVYRQEGQPCSRCGTIIERVKLGGRSTHYCPKCQPI